MSLTLNTLTNLMPSLYKNLDVVSREVVGFLPAVTLDASADRYAYGQTVYSQVAPAVAAGDTAATMTMPSPSAQTVGTKSLSISKVRSCIFGWTGEDEAAASGAGVSNIKANQIQQCFRTLVNEMEVDLGGLSIHASRAGLISDTSFLHTDLSDLVNLRTILVENGAAGDWQLVLGSQEVAKLLKQTQLTKVNEAGTDSFVRQGVFQNLFGFSIRESAGVARPAIGTITSGSTVNTAAYSIGDTVLTLASAGSGSIVAGDVITLAGDTHQYVVASGDAQTSNGGTFTLAEPGLKVAIAGSASPAIAVLAIGDRPLAFSRSAIVIATRLPKIPQGGDAAIDATTMTDLRSGISFDVRVYPGHMMNAVEVSAAWGVAAIKPEHIAVGLGL